MAEDNEEDEAYVVSCQNCGTEFDLNSMDSCPDCGEDYDEEG